MAYKVIILYRLYMPSYVLGTFTEYPYGRFLWRDFHYLQYKLSKKSDYSSPASTWKPPQVTVSMK